MCAAPRRRFEPALNAFKSNAARSDKQSWTPLHKAADAGDVHDVRRLLDTGADKEARSITLKRTPLHLAAARGHADLLPLLITPTTLKAQDDSQYTPLHCAIEANKAEAVAVLLAAGSPLTAPDPGPMMAMFGGSTWGLTPSPLTFAIDCLQFHNGYTPQSAIQLVGAVKAELRKPGTPEATAQGLRRDLTYAFVTAAAVGCQDLVARLLKAGGSKTARDQHGRSVLGLAATSGHAHLVPLLATPSNINQADGSGFPALHLAAKQGHVDTVAALLAAGATHMALSRQGRTALVVAAAEGRKEVVVLLLAAGAAVYQPNMQGESAVAAATRKGYPHLVRVLLEAIARESSQQAQQAPGHQQQGQPQQLGPAGLVELLVAAALPLAGCTIRCSGFLEMLLDVLGPRVTGEVCQAVQERLQAALAAGEPPMASRLPGRLDSKWSDAPQVSHMAEALLLGWFRAVEHAARQPLVERLQRLVPGVRAPSHLQQQNQEKQAGQEGNGEPQKQAEVHKQVVQLVEDATTAASQPPLALGPLGQVARRMQEQMSSECAQLQQYRDYRHTSCSVNSCSTFLCRSLPLAGADSNTVDGDDIPLLGRLMHRGLVEAARSRVKESGSSSGTSSGRAQALTPDKERAARSFHPPGVYTTFLAAWVEARRQLQLQVPRAVLAAVKGAPQQQQEHEAEQQQQGDGVEEAELLLSQLAILPGADEAEKATAGDSTTCRCVLQ